MNILPSPEGIDVQFHDMGHLLGSASIEVWVTEEVDGSVRILHCIQRLKKGLSASPSLSIPPLRLKLLNVGAVAKHDVAQVRRGKRSDNLSRKSLPAIIKEPQKVKEADYIVIESTYGDRTHGDVIPDYIGEFTRILRESMTADSPEHLDLGIHGDIFPEQLHTLRALDQLTLKRTHRLIEGSEEGGGETGKIPGCAGVPARGCGCEEAA